MKVVVDMCLSPKWVEILNSAGIETRHWSLIGAANAADETIFAFAKNEGFVILTSDLDFGTLLASAREAKPSVVQLRLPRISVNKASTAVLQALRQFQAEIEAGALVTIDAATARVRILPLR